MAGEKPPKDVVDKLKELEARIKYLENLVGKQPK